MNANPSPSATLEGTLRVASLGVVRARGADAASFLHGQLTNDVAHLRDDEARLAGYCSAKGRLLASFLVWRSGDDLLLACSADLLAATLERLKMFVLRAKCVLSDASDELPIHGLSGPAGAIWLGADLPGAVGGKCERADGSTVIRLPDAAGLPRCLCVGPASAPPLPVLAADTWHWLEVRSGVARIVAATVERFVPQMLNYELVGGVDFGKGCYPGQEVVARSQYRGTIKRRALLFDTDGAAPAPGTEVFHSEDPDQPAGQVVDAAPTPSGAGTGGALALVEVKLGALDTGSLHLGTPGGALLRRIDMPYPLPAQAGVAG